MKNSRFLVCLISLAFVFSATGCAAHLTRGEEMRWGILMQKSGIYNPIPFKSKPVTTVWSVVIPGTGHFYVGEAGLGVVYFLGNILWPINILWTVPGGVQAAEVVNKRRTIDYYQTGAYSDVVERLRRKGKLPSNFKERDEVNLNEV